nr:signal peptidase II [uncultured Sellimonas sp.]
MKKKNGRKSYIMAVILVIAAVLLDQYTKYLAVLYLKDGPALVLWNRVFELTYLENRGAAFGLLQNQQIFFVCIAVVIFAFVAYCYVRIPKTSRYLPLRLCGIFIVAGAAGNLIDRIRLGYVVDFFYFRLIDFPVFNVADIYVTVSFAVLILLIFFFYKEEDLQFLGRKKGAGTDGK